MILRTIRLALVGLALACARNQGAAAEGNEAVKVALPALPSQVDSLWRIGVADFREGDWDAAKKIFERLTLSIPAGDSRGPRAHFFLAECLLQQHENLQATREFRKVSDQFPNDSLAPEALLRAGDAYTELWRRPELDPTYGQTALATYQELLSRYPGTSAAARADRQVAELNDRFAYKAYKSALYYKRLKAYDSAILYLKDLLSTYPKSSVAGSALVSLVESYHAIGYEEDLKETCDYLRQFHPEVRDADQICPPPSHGAS